MSGELRFALRDMAVRLGAPSHRWYTIRPAWDLATTVAIQAEADRLRARGVLKGIALSRASGALGVAPESVRSRLRRWGNAHLPRSEKKATESI